MSLLVLVCLFIAIVYISLPKDGSTSDEISPRHTRWSHTQQLQQQTCNASKYHMLMTAQSKTYLDWQSLIAYYHYKNQKRSSPCNDVGGFTRLVSDRVSTDELASTIPSVFLPAIDDTILDERYGGFKVLNRPYSMLKFLEQSGLDHIEEDYIYLAETDHILMQPMKNGARKGRPVGYHFGYMNPKPEFENIVLRYCSSLKSIEDVPPIGPSPVIIHKDDLRVITPEWLRISLALQADPEAVKAFGWVLEMWGFAIAAACKGIKFQVWEELQVEPTAATDLKDLSPFPIFHYTFGIEYDLNGDPVTDAIGEWSLDKRHYMNHYPPKHLEPPPEKANAGAKFLTEAWNEAMDSYPDWKEAPINIGTIGWEEKPISSQAIRAHKLEGLLNTTWTWVLEHDSSPGTDPILTFLDNGVLKSIWDTGSWMLMEQLPRELSAVGWFCEASQGNIFLKLKFGNNLHWVCLNEHAGTLHSIRVGDGELNKGILVTYEDNDATLIKEAKSLQVDQK